MTKEVETALAVRKYVVDNKREIELALPRHLNIERFIRVSFTVLSQNPKLYLADRRSLLGALVQTAQLGLEPGIIGQAFLVPFNDRKRGLQTVQLIPGYKGLIALARRSGEISTVHAWPVYEGDHYRVVLGTDPKIEHVPSDKPIAWLEGERGERHWRRRAMVGVYAVARMKDGAVQFDSMRRDECEWHRDRFSRSAGDGPWITDFEEMSKKTVLRRLTKLLPMSVEMQTAVALDELAEVGVAQDLGHLIDVTPDPEPPAPKGKKLDTLVKNFTPPPDREPEPPVRQYIAPEEEAPPNRDDADRAYEREQREAPPREEPEGEQREIQIVRPESLSEMALTLRRSTLLAQRTKLGLSDAEFGALCQKVSSRPFGKWTAALDFDRLGNLLAGMLGAKMRASRRGPDGAA